MTMAWTGQNHQQQFQMLQQQLDAPEDLASHFHLLPLIEAIADGMERGVRDQQLENLVSELTAQFMKCQQILNNVSGSVTSKNVQAEKQKLEEHERQLDLRSELLSKLKGMVEQVIGTSG